jgi:hypothetical protein
MLAAPAVAAQKPTARAQDDPLSRAYAVFGVGAELLEQRRTAASKRTAR